MSLSSSVRQGITKKLLRWYSLHKRDLPWRRTKAPYRIWVSEIMLQQTQVATVIPYYRRWIKRFPTLLSLAQARLGEVLRYWAGLGYYRRARMLHLAARHIQKKLKGTLPRTAEALRALPGIGRYTAGAIASIAFEEKTPVLDGNVIRILTRIFGIAQDVALPRTLEKLWALAAALLPDKNPGDMNQALMELGATLCFPGNPECPRCPVKKCCAACKNKKTSFYPVRGKKEICEKLEMTALVLQNDRGDVWIETQRKDGRWGGLWMFPFWKNKKAMFAEIKDFRRAAKFFMALKHSHTKYRITLTVYRIKTPESKTARQFPERREGRWVSIRRTRALGFPSHHRRIADALLAENIARPSPAGKPRPKTA